MLKGKGRSYLRSLGNNLNPIMQIGKNNIDDAVILQISDAIAANELIKISILKNSILSAREACDYICEKIGAEPVQVIGNKFIIFKKADKDSKFENLPANE